MDKAESRINRFCSSFLLTPDSRILTPVVSHRAPRPKRIVLTVSNSIAASSARL